MTYISKFNCIASIVGKSSTISTESFWCITCVSENLELEYWQHLVQMWELKVEKTYDSQKTSLAVSGTQTQVIAVTSLYILS